MKSPMHDRRKNIGTKIKHEQINRSHIQNKKTYIGKKSRDFSPQNVTEA